MALRRMAGILAAAGAIAAHYPAVSAPLPVELNRLNAAIDAEAQERRQADTLLFGEIAELRAKVDEPGVVGRWAFTGTQTCLASTTGFNPSTLLPVVPSPPPQEGMTFSVATTTTSGISEFRADGTGTISTTFHTIGHPVDFIQGSGGFLPGFGGFRTGGGQIAARESTFTYNVQGDTVFIDEAPAPALVTKGGNVGAMIVGYGSPRFAGRVSKDHKSMGVMSEDMVVERNVITPPAGSPASPQTTERVCQRARTFYRIH